MHHTRGYIRSNTGTFSTSLTGISLLGPPVRAISRMQYGSCVLFSVFGADPGLFWKSGFYCLKYDSENGNRPSRPSSGRPHFYVIGTVHFQETIPFGHRYIVSCIDMRENSAFWSEGSTIIYDSVRNRRAALYKNLVCVCLATKLHIIRRST